MLLLYLLSPPPDDQNSLTLLLVITPLVNISGCLFSPWTLFSGMEWVYEQAQSTYKP